MYKSRMKKITPLTWKHTNIIFLRLFVSRKTIKNVNDLGYVSIYNFWKHNGVVLPYHVTILCCQKKWVSHAWVAFIINQSLQNFYELQLGSSFLVVLWDCEFCHFYNFWIVQIFYYLRWRTGKYPGVGKQRKEKEEWCWKITISSSNCNHCVFFFSECNKWEEDVIYIDGNLFMLKITDGCCWRFLCIKNY